jgi:hypothetical protein
MTDYYSDPAIRARMLEFLCGDPPGRTPCEYLTAGDESELRHRQPRPVNELASLWNQRSDINRSLWDRESLILHLDIEYVNFDFPGEPYLDPGRTFELLQPVYETITEILKAHDLNTLMLLSGRGPHFVWRVRQDSTALQHLAGMARITPGTELRNGRPHRPHSHPIPPLVGKAYAGLGLLMEFLANRIKQAAASRAAIPVEITALEVGPGERGMEMISIDISEYGDPLSTRVMRVPFSYYLKPWQQRSAIGEQVVRKLPPLFTIPLQGIDLQAGWKIMRNAQETWKLAKGVSALIPEQSAGTEHLTDSYQRSSLKQFHDWFYGEAALSSAAIASQYSQIPGELLPPCARHIIDHSNDLLLRPTLVQRLVRVLLSLGWHPRHIAALIQAEFERDNNWGDRWISADPAFRAEFYTRVFAGLFVTHRDDLVDFNCKSAQEEQLCFSANCGFNLEPYRASLLDRRKYERLACRPLNRLFLPTEHL